ncbi:hypothetical protein O9992_21080 [Vibrio lentus]|nr:hypothetical protein [Vibrio lentus]
MTGEKSLPWLVYQCCNRHRITSRYKHLCCRESILHSESCCFWHRSGCGLVTMAIRCCSNDCCISCLSTLGAVVVGVPVDWRSTSFIAEIAPKRLADIIHDQQWNFWQVSEYGFFGLISSFL